jgi:nuclear pore complex protein Nup205
VWKTVAFMLLDSLVYLCRTERQSSILTALTRHGILSNFVHGLKESDVRLQGVLKPDPGRPFVVSELIQAHLFAYR